MSLIGIVGAIGSAVKFFVKPALKLTNKAPDGTLTGIGSIVAGAGVAASALSGQIVTAENLVPLVKAACEIVVAIGGVIVALGAQRAHAK